VLLGCVLDLLVKVDQLRMHLRQIYFFLSFRRAHIARDVQVEIVLLDFSVPSRTVSTIALTSGEWSGRLSVTAFGLVPCLSGLSEAWRRIMPNQVMPNQVGT
jgi:hypothetical protein